MSNIPDFAWILIGLGLVGIAFAFLREQNFRIAMLLGFAAMGVMLVPGVHIAFLPALLIAGLVFGHLKLNRLPIDRVFWGLQAGLWVFYLLSNILNDFSLGMFGRVVLNGLFALLIVLWLRDQRDTKTMMIGLIVAFLYSVPIGLTAFWGYIPRYSFLSVNDPLDAPRFAGLFGDPNVMALLGCFVFMVLLDDVVHRQLFKSGTFWKILFMVLIVILILAGGSRSGIINLLTAVPLYLVFQFRNASRAVVKKLTLATASASAVVVLVLALTPFGELVYDMTIGRTADEGGAETRIGRTLSAALVIANDYPLGVGTGMTTARADFAEGITDRVQPHNSVVQILVENGYLAALFLVASVVYCFLRLAPLAWRGQRICGLDAGVVFASLVGWLWMFNGYDLSWIQIGWFIPAVATAIWLRGEAQPKDPNRETQGAMTQ